MTAGLRHRARRTTEQRLILAEQRQHTYCPNQEVAEQMKDVTIGALVGVTAAGKSHIIPHITKLGGPDFSEVGNISSRDRRPSDPENFRGNQPVANLLDRIEDGEIVVYMIHPQTRDIYAGDASSYTTRFVIQPTISHIAEYWETHSPFKRFVPIGIALDGATWDERLDDKRRTIQRMLEAQTCVAWLRAHSRRIPILENETGKEELIAQAIVDILHDSAHPHPLDNLNRVDLLLLQLAAVATRELRKLETV